MNAQKYRFFSPNSTTKAGFHKKSNRILCFIIVGMDRKRKSIDFVETKHEA
jgi:hypothetical protein